MTAFRILAAALAVTVVATAASAGETRPKPIVDTPCDRHDLGPKFPPIKFPPIAQPRPQPGPRPIPNLAPVTRPK